MDDKLYTRNDLLSYKKKPVKSKYFLLCKLQRL